MKRKRSAPANYRMVIKYRSGNRSGIKGVGFNKEKWKWTTQVMVAGKGFYFGSHDNIGDAEKAVMKGREKLHMEFSRHE